VFSCKYLLKIISTIFFHSYIQMYLEKYLMLHKWVLVKMSTSITFYGFLVKRSSRMGKLEKLINSSYEHPLEKLFY